MLHRCTFLMLGCWAGALSAQTVSRAVPVRYTAAQLDCSRFLETTESAIQTETAGRTRKQATGRSGVWEFRAAANAQGLSLEGWLDSLSVWRRSEEGTLRPDTDGLLGGRYRGTLTGSGTYIARVRPFVPDELAEVARMSTALDDFFPRLPLHPLRPGEIWSDSAGLTIRRLADSTGSHGPLFRFEVTNRRESRSASVVSDTAPLKLHQVSRERGTFVWHPVEGLLRSDRLIAVEISIPTSRGVPRPVRSTIEQRIGVERDLTPPGDQQGRCPDQASGR